MSAGAAGEAEGRKGPGVFLDAGAFARVLPRGSPLMGLDVGTKTVGLALSDVTHMIASGLTTLARTKFTADARARSILQRRTVSAASSSACPSISTARTARAPRPPAPSPAASPG
jgi:hypothetical protein